MAQSRESRDDAARRLEELFRAHHRAVVAFVRRRAAAEGVDDVVAETFLVAWRRLDRVPAGLALPWLLAIARNVLATQRRAELRRDALYGRLQANVRSFDADASDTEAAGGAVAAALIQLSEKDREVLTLIGWDCLRPREAAKVLGESPGTFYVRLHRAKRRFRRLLDEQSPERSSAVPIRRSIEAKEPIR